MLQKSTQVIAAALLLTAAIFSPANSNDTAPPRLTTDHFIFFAPQTVSDAELSGVVARAETVFVRATQFLGRSPDTLPFRFNLYQTLEEKGLATGYTLPAHAMAGAGVVDRHAGGVVRSHGVNHFEERRGAGSRRRASKDMSAGQA